MKTTLPRILKYTPAVVLGLLLVAWVVSWFGLAGYCLRSGRCYVALGQDRGSAVLDALSMKGGLKANEGGSTGPGSIL